MDYKIVFQKRTRKEWLKEIPEVIYKLVSGYNFYYNGEYIHKVNNIEDVVKSNYEKNRHKIVLYQSKNENQVYLVVYSKKTVTIYYTNEYEYKERNAYYIDENGEIYKEYNRNRVASVRRFMNKFNLANKEAVKWNKEKHNLKDN